ncbi:transglutaminase-like cysteine peptidase [Chelativorans sp. Marseille-P2723]|uniref:transglutaminase-like cysteine peptidase n=1 Tax=Chelativorans sp. Marseille-P2723 TaxID=2709133 RepID=UPI001FEF5A00|nr:transglutaminase-like cysteine peptidase [Chelativorans sp. Marseille-P2723]
MSTLHLAAVASMMGLGVSAASASVYMPTGGYASQPIGHYEFCQREPADCREIRPVKPVEMTRDLWALLLDVNKKVNTSVIPRTDMQMWGVEEYWSYPDLYGDCEDYALEKRRLLIEAGVPASSLLIAVVLQPNGDGHAVLAVTTSMGDFILDNMDSRILLWTETSYRFLKRQSERGGHRWVSIEDGRDVVVGSVQSSR